jgi:hypothetical protein
MKIPRIHVSEVLEKGAGMFSFIIGFGIVVLLFHRAYTIEPVLAVPAEDLSQTVSKFDGKCYRYRVEDASCQFSSSL